MARLCLLVLTLLGISFSSVGARAQPDSSNPPPRDYRSAGGVSVGLPQIIALTVEREVSPHLRLQGNFGTAVAISSLNGRMIAVADDLVVQPYLFMGGGVLTALGALDSTVFPYVWYGAGLRLELDRVILFAEAGTVSALASSEMDESAPVGAVGLLVEY
jgi:hypothetical protein